MTRAASLLVAACLLASPVIAAPPHQTFLCAMNADGSRAWDLVEIKEYLYFCSPEISPNGTKIAGDGWREGESNGDAHVLIVDMDSGAIDDLGIGCMPTWSPDGEQIAFCRYGRGVFIRSLATAEERLIDPAGWAVQWAPNGAQLAYVRGGQIRVHDLTSGKTRDTFAGASPYDFIQHNPTWSPDSARVCFLGSRDSKTELASVDVKTGDIKVLADAAEFLPDIAWHPDGSRVVVPNNQGRLIEVATDGKSSPMVLKGQPEDRSNSGVSWSRDGNTLIFVTAKASHGRL